MRRGYRDDVETGGFAGERVFAGRADVRYVLQPAPGASDRLVVALSSAQAPGTPARYRWHRLLADVPCHRLFVLDDHGPGQPLPGPSWYLGPGPPFVVADAVCTLIERVGDELEVERDRTVTLGSSMGGWAALYLGARVGAGDVIAGEPQTRLGDYLCGPAFHHLAEHITGGSAAAERELLDRLLFDALRAAAAPPRVHLFCGRESPYLANHIRPLLALLEELGAEHAIELGEGFDHDDVGRPFSTYLRARLAGPKSGITA